MFKSPPQNFDEFWIGVPSICWAPKKRCLVKVKCLELKSSTYPGWLSDQRSRLSHQHHSPHNLWLETRVSFGTTHIAHGNTGDRLGLQVSKNTKNLSWNLPRLLCEAFLFLAFQCNFRHFYRHLQVTLFSCNRWQIGCVSVKKLFRSMKNSMIFLFLKTVTFFTS